MAARHGPRQASSYTRLSSSRSHARASEFPISGSGPERFNVRKTRYTTTNCMPVEADRVPSAAEIFPSAPRVIYEQNPLTLVVCQLRFNPILRIDTEKAPAAFQERIRHEFPLYREKQLTPDLAQLPDAVQNLLRAAGVQSPKQQSAYDFVSEDETWTVGLTREFLSLSTPKYRRWEEFRGKLQGPLQALLDIYEPSLFIRTGLRYRNVIQRSLLGLEETQWKNLLGPSIAGVFSAKEVAGQVESCQTKMQIRLSDHQGSVQIIHGIAENPDNENEECYVIDNDFFTDEKTENQDALDVLDNFNRQSGRLFRWCISERLNEAMEPSRVDPAP